MIKEQPIKLLKHNLKIGKMDRETELFVKKVIKEKTLTELNTTSKS